MARTPSRYAIHLLLKGGHHEVVHFQTLEDFQKWYGGVLTTAASEAFVNVPISELPGEFLVIRPSSLHAIRVEPVFSSLDSDDL
jgi:hypothetical protein